ncbi:hypothetical protein RN22_02000 [Grimontia sp. AD028]|nr:hypothetical protein RN22_02000 [Grimontia sp. AD028]
MLADLSLSDTMKGNALRHNGCWGTLLALLLVFFSLPSFAADSVDTNSDHSNCLVVTQHEAQTSAQDALTSLNAEHRAPAKSLTPNLSTLLRNGSWLPERLANTEPEYELVIELANVATLLDYYHYDDTFSHWHDWTRSPPATRHRIAGWKDSNLQYRFISQAQA